MTRLTGYGPIIKCVQHVPYDESPAYYEGCPTARQNRLFQLPVITEPIAQVTAIIMVNNHCRDCKANHGQVDVFWRDKGVI